MFLFKKNKIENTAPATSDTVNPAEAIIAEPSVTEPIAETGKPKGKRGRPPKAKNQTALPAPDREEIVVSSAPLSDSGDWLQAKGQLTVDVYQTENEFCIQAPVAGVEPSDISVAIENEMLIIKGHRHEPEDTAERSYIYRECYWGSFSRQILLPEDVDAKNIRASLKKGILIVRIPKIRHDKKQIKITVE